MNVQVFHWEGFNKSHTSFTFSVRKSDELLRMRSIHEYLGILFLTILTFDRITFTLLQKRKAPQISPELSKDVQLTCAICMDATKEETSTVCGHIFCRPCILGAIKTQKKCPTCRRKLTNSNIHRIYLSSGTR
ncbi:hypothetical protein L7F22_026914 [Adiantum nelumboides]|nr:hypothetical protein [Adiantum nelumboides]